MNGRRHRQPCVPLRPGGLGADATGSTDADVYAINAAGVAFGSATNAGTAPRWAVALSARTPLDARGADGISGTDWVTGYGSFDPDGRGPLALDERAFLRRLPPSVPEPASLAGLLVATISLRRRR